MKKLLFLIAITFLFSCEKSEPKEQCWTCTTVRWPYGMADNKIIDSEFETCDQGVMLLWDGKIEWGISHMYSTSCK
jgi:hypothetical protein